jgi:viroplasmin and RNaseH domain-containing protein
MIKSCGYSESEKLLEIEFGNGAVFQYSGFPKDAWESFEKSESAGRHFHGNIKGKYPEKKVEQDEKSATS